MLRRVEEEQRRSSEREQQKQVLEEKERLRKQQQEEHLFLEQSGVWHGAMGRCCCLMVRSGGAERSWCTVELHLHSAPPLQCCTTPMH